MVKHLPKSSVSILTNYKVAAFWLCRARLNSSIILTISRKKHILMNIENGKMQLIRYGGKSLLSGKIRNIFLGRKPPTIMLVMNDFIVSWWEYTGGGFFCLCHCELWHMMDCCKERLVRRYKDGQIEGEEGRGGDKKTSMEEIIEFVVEELGRMRSPSALNKLSI